MKTSVVIVLAVVTGALVAPRPAQALVHPESAVVTEPFGADGYRVDAMASRYRSVGAAPPANVCLSAYRISRSGDRRTTVSQYGCTDDARYAFGSDGATASASGTALGNVTETISKREDGEWVFVSERVLAKGVTTRFRLTWTGTGEVRRRPMLWCGGFILLRCSPGLESSRDATVSGRIRFDGLGLRADVPAGHRGTMTWR